VFVVWILGMCGAMCGMVIEHKRDRTIVWGSVTMIFALLFFLCYQARIEWPKFYLVSLMALCGSATLVFAIRHFVQWVLEKQRI
jgi:uncharacterized membrane protein YoaK (UPF0700 family)